MVNRRFAQVATSDDEEEQAPLHQRRKRLKILLEEEDDEEEEEEIENKDTKKSKGKEDEEKPQPQEEEEEEEEEEPLESTEPKPVGDPVRVSGKGKSRRKHFHTFEYDGNHYTLEDPVLLIPEDKDQKPYVAIIKDITQCQDGSMMMKGQWFYRPEEAPKKGGGSWKPIDTRELFYSFHQDEVPAESVMHRCVTHFIPEHKQLPKRKQHPGFIIQKVYDVGEKKLFMLTDKDFHDGKQEEINVLVEKTLQHIGNDLLDIETEQPPADQEHEMKNKRRLKRKNISPLDDVSREEEGNPKGDKRVKPVTPGSCLKNASEYYRILTNFNALTGDVHRDKWLERMLQRIQGMCNSDEERGDNAVKKVNVDEIKNTGSNMSSELPNDCQVKAEKVSKCFIWPDAAVSAIVALEKASHEALSSDFQKYNQKLRSLDFNLKGKLARRLLNGELEPSKIINMTPTELKEGFTAEEIATKEPDESQHMQMTDARCSRCTDSKVGVRDIIHAGHGDRYQLECVGCGNSWYASRDEVSALTDGPASKRSIGTEQLATASLGDGKKTGEVVTPVLDHQKSLGKSGKDDSIEAKVHAD